MQELRSVADELRLVLDEIEPTLGRDELTTPALGELKSVVDSVRVTLLAYVNASGPAAYNSSRRKFRLRRARQTCDAIRTGLAEGSIDDTTEGLPELRATALETVECLQRLIGKT